MKITTSAYNKLYNLTPKKPPECGGILGSAHDGYITDVILDKIKNPTYKACQYEPNVEFLNACIDEWSANKIIFKGVFHTHFAGVKTLSNADIKYIYAIMNNMPDEITHLYFPVFVIPNQELVCYKAERAAGKIQIHSDDISFINQ